MGSVCTCGADSEKNYDGSEQFIPQQRRSPAKNGNFPKEGGQDQSENYEEMSINSSSVNSAFDILNKDILETLSDLTRFLKTLPAKSKQHIWQHSVKKRDDNGTKKVENKTSSKDHISRLLCDCVIVYIKYLDRSQNALTMKDVKQHVNECADYLFSRYNPLFRDKFENDPQYFVSMIEDFIQYQKNSNSNVNS